MSRATDSEHPQPGEMGVWQIDTTMIHPDIESSAVSDSRQSWISMSPVINERINEAIDKIHPTVHEQSSDCGVGRFATDTIPKRHHQGHHPQKKVPAGRSTVEQTHQGFAQVFRVLWQFVLKQTL